MSSYTLDDDLTSFFNNSAIEPDDSVSVLDADEVKKLFKTNYSDEQLKVVTWSKENPLVVASGAGSGKTTTIISNILYKIVDKGVKPSSVLCITFSHSASEDMRERYGSMILQMPKNNRPNSIIKPTFSTFHAFFKHILESNLNNGFKYNVSTTAQYTHELVRLIKNYSGKQQIEILNNMVNKRGEMINKLVGLDGITNVKFNETDVGYTLDNYIEVMSYYDELKKRDNALDFEDMQTLLYKTLKNNDATSKKIIEDFTARYKHIYIDEYQDINPIQKEIMDMLMDGDSRNLVVIGDESQSIYGFRGSDPSYIMNFKHSYLGAEMLFLNTNYRSSSAIIDPIKYSIRRNKNKIDKDLKAFHQGGSVTVIPTKGSSDYFKIAEVVNSKVKDWDIDELPNFVILVRTNQQRTLIADALVDRSIQVNLGNMNYSLRNMPLYKDLMSVIDMVMYQDNALFAQYGKRCFKNINGSVVKRYYDIDEDVQSWYDDVIVKNKYSVDDSKIDAVKNINHTTSMKVRVQNAWYLLQPYYMDLSHKGFMSMKRQEEVYNYILAITGDFTAEEFTELESKKDRMLAGCINGNYGIEITTFHASKGLEWSDGLLLGINNSITPNAPRLNELVKNHKYAEAEAFFEEERRAFYVAWTRIKHNLYVEFNVDDCSVFLHEVKGVEGLDYWEHTSLLDVVDDSDGSYKRYLEATESK